MELSSTLPEADIDQILAVIRARTDEPIVFLRDGEFGPEVKTGSLYGHIWQVRRAPSGWKVLQGAEWCT
jgi:hypothetical protein